MSDGTPAEEKSFTGRDALQIRRATLLLDLADVTTDEETRFVIWVGALHLARAVPEYWFTTAQQIPISLNVQGREKDALGKRLLTEFEDEFRKVRRYELITDLRRWDYHWEPLIDARTIPPNMTYGSGAPMKLSTGTQPNSSVAYVGGKVVTTGSGHRVGRTNYYRINQSRYVDSARSEALPLGLAIREFLADLPACIRMILEIPEVVHYLASRA